MRARRVAGIVATLSLARLRAGSPSRPDRPAMPGDRAGAGQARAYVRIGAETVAETGFVSMYSVEGKTSQFSWLWGTGTVPKGWSRATRERRSSRCTRTGSCGGAMTSRRRPAPRRASARRSRSRSSSTTPGASSPSATRRATPASASLHGSEPVSVGGTVGCGRRPLSAPVRHGSVLVLTHTYPWGKIQTRDVDRERVGQVRPRPRRAREGVAGGPAAGLHRALHQHPARQGAAPPPRGQPAADRRGRRRRAAATPGCARIGACPIVKLSRYQAKRDFGATPEPAGDAREARRARGRALRRPGAPRHAPALGPAPRARRRAGVLGGPQRHPARSGPRTAWPCAPRTTRSSTSTSTARSPRATTAPGTMTIWDTGTYELHKWEERKVEVTFHGERLRGRYGLFPIGREPGDKDWMIHRMDPPSDPGREPMPEGLVPMLARAGTLPPDEEQWSFEVKWDGVRALAYVAAGAAAAGEPGRQRRHRDLPRAARARQRAGHARGRARRRDRRLRRAGPAELRASAEAHERQLAGRGAPAGRLHAGRSTPPLTCSTSTATR